MYLNIPHMLAAAITVLKPFGANDTKVAQLSDSSAEKCPRCHTAMKILVASPTIRIPQCPRCFYEPR